ncbi:MAG: hypothetical protein EPO22_00855, partial [Dehalococcoidia bacterium]
MRRTAFPPPVLRSRNARPGPRYRRERVVPRLRAFVGVRERGEVPPLVVRLVDRRAGDPVVFARELAALTAPDPARVDAAVRGRVRDAVRVVVRDERPFAEPDVVARRRMVPVDDLRGVVAADRRDVDVIRRTPFCINCIFRRSISIPSSSMRPMPSSAAFGSISDRSEE